ncbi:MAG TPA: 16S rRNA (adenine(1518)-N(6)/adenine(1519)-N(6))-dimethyltransferase RsmA [Hyphomicrobiaceae bacterium]|nr:16S rRNA (adenine(1518)-N(6)/adenine(1519)-N(6))-dimethyltransferase RsmA [Hyphomicrobiaceae bacterium]
MSGGASPDGLPPLREVIRELDLGAKKSLGQNFILDLNLTRKIARVAGPLHETTVVEIGPGPGGLTRGLLLEGASRVIAVEADPRCRPALEAIAAAYPAGRLDIVMADALEADWSALIGEAPGRVVIAANLPYNIATRLLIGWLETEPWPPWFSAMALMFQKEVAERIVASPDTKAYGRLAVIAQWRTRARIALTLGPEAFTPPPKVASAVVELIPRERCEPACSVATLGRVTAAAFGQRRKMLRQSLKPLYREPAILLERLGLDPESRAETLTPSDFARLAAALDGS